MFSKSLAKASHYNNNNNNNNNHNDIYSAVIYGASHIWEFTLGHLGKVSQCQMAAIW